MRRDLLDAAMALMEEHRDLSFSLRKLAEAANTSTMSIYTHFGNREGLYRALATEAFGIFAAEVEAALARTSDGGAVEQLEAIALAYRQFWLAHPSAFGLIFGGTLSFDSVEPLRSEFEGLPAPSENGYLVYGRIMSVIERGVQHAEFRRDVEPRLVLDAYWAQVHGLVALEGVGYVRSPDDAAERFSFGVRSILEGLRPPQRLHEPSRPASPTRQPPRPVCITTS